MRLDLSENNATLREYVYVLGVTTDSPQAAADELFVVFLVVLRLTPVALLVIGH